MNKKERDVLHSLCNGDITFSDASSQLGVSKERIEEMLEDYSWIPSSERLAELCQIEMETISYIREISQPIKFRVSNTQVEFRFDQMHFVGFVRIPNIIYPAEYPPLTQEYAVLSHTEYNGIAYIEKN